MKINVHDNIRGKCGEQAVFEFSNGVLTVSGKGALAPFKNTDSSPFLPFRDKVEEIKIENGITEIGELTFSGFPALVRIDIAGSVDIVAYRSFSECPRLRSVRFAEGVRVLAPKVFENCKSLEYIELPSSLRAVDFKCFMHDAAIKTVRYAGTELEWRRRVRVGTSARGNDGLLGAHFYYRAHSKRYYELASAAGDIVRRGGDGNMHIVAPDLSVPGVNGKSGDCTVIVLPNGKTIMIDAGLPACFVHVIELIDAMGLKSIDYFVLSHPHSDHFGGINKVIDYIASRGGRIGEFIYSGYAHKGLDKKIKKLLAAQGAVLRCNICEGDRLEFGEVAVDIFNPSREEVESSAERITDTEGVNNTSLGMIFNFGDLKYLTSGDLYASRERRLAKDLGEALHADIAKTNHHGLFTSNTDEWISAVSPRILISDSDDAPWTSFAEKLANLGIEHYIVSDRGLTVIEMTGDGKISATCEY